MNQSRNFTDTPRHLTPTQAEHKAIWDELLANSSGRTTCGRPRMAVHDRCVDCGRKAFDAIQGQALCVRHMGERARELQSREGAKVGA